MDKSCNNCFHKEVCAIGSKNYKTTGVCGRYFDRGLMIPTKPDTNHIISDGLVVIHTKHCPNCGKTLAVNATAIPIYEKVNHCSDCGQKLDWTDVES